MGWEDGKPEGGGEYARSDMVAAPSTLFAIHGNLDGEKSGEFQEREQFIGLVIGDEEFLMPIALVREINMLTPITFVPNAPQYVDGVINLRGNIMPVVNLRKMMGITRAEPTAQSRIIIARQEETTFGLLVDGITYVVALLPSEVEHQTLPGKGSGAEYIGGISKQGTRVHGILDLGRILKGVGCGDEAADDEPQQSA